jgi:hypothetical protein
MGKRSFLMKKLLPVFFILITTATFSQSPVEVVSKSYFRAHPFDMRFSSFVTSLQQDPWFTLEKIYRRTDSNFFFLTGNYKNFIPFRYTPKELRLVIAEEEIIHTDSLKTHDTIINLQLMGITDSGIANMKAVEKEFKRFHSNHGGRFSTSLHEPFTDGGEGYNYFISPFSISPVTVAWGRLENLQYTFTITIRFKLKENVATYILMPDEH